MLRRLRGCHWYYGAAVGLLIVAAALRCYNLPENTLWFDEANIVYIAGGAPGEMVNSIRHGPVHPILNPLLLNGALRIDFSPLAVRLPSVLASVSAIGIILFLLPRWGLPREAAFLAALLAALFPTAIEQAQSARPYSLDALLATLLIAGWFQYRQTGKIALLSIALLLSPLTHYALILFGAAVLATALTGQAGDAGNADRVDRDRNAPPDLRYLIRRYWQRQRALLGPVISFLTGCLATYWLTLRFHLDDQGRVVSYLQPFYYGGELYDLAALLQFVITRAGDFLRWPLPDGVALLAGAALVGNTALAFRRGQFHPLPGLLLGALLIAMVAAVLRLYPFGATIRASYLTPILFVTAGFALHWGIGELAVLTRRAWLQPVLLTALAGLTAAAGIAALVAANPWQDKDGRLGVRTHIRVLFDTLDAQVRAEDLVYISEGAIPSVKFYRPEKPANYYYGHPDANLTAAQRLQDIVDTALIHPVDTERIWLVFLGSCGKPLVGHLTGWQEQGRMERYAGDACWGLYLTTGDNPLVARVAQAKADYRREYAAVTAGQPAGRAYFDLYLQNDKLHYIKERCGVGDTAARFLLHISPQDGADLPAGGQTVGFDNRDFNFAGNGAAFDGKCMASVPLPDYPIAELKTGQFTKGGATWETTLTMER